MYSDLFANELQAWRKRRALLLDLPEPQEYALGHIPGSPNLPLRQLSEAIEQIAEPLVLVCAWGNRSSTAAEYLELVGKTQVANLLGRIAAAVRQGYRQ